MKLAWEKWKLLAEKVGTFQSNLIFSILYFLFFVPTGLLVSFFIDSLNVKSTPGWNDYDSQSANMEEMRGQ